MASRPVGARALMWSGYPKMFLEPSDARAQGIEPSVWDICMTMCPPLFLVTAVIRLPIWIFARKRDFPSARLLK